MEDIKEQYITFETAKLAKEKGFEQKIGLFYKSGGAYYNSDGELNGNCIKQIKSRLGIGIEENNDNGLISAPTQSILQKWLRDNHYLYVSIIETSTYALVTGIGFYVEVLKPEETEHGRVLTTLFASTMFFGKYEEAIEVGLIEALKQIQIK